ncbi:hypothetical protein QN277_027811 [Acacia crassicarpa]|uniref:Uncharacterized protein n=1 Tax=Acacia crassicarpa TaxID=499986 RepID=A0AAE1J5Y8_9FABA|nr:hypothetical protein QN277_027811 [Acacia crassicarpa]
MWTGQRFSLAKESGKNCYMIGAKGLCIIWGDTPRYWNWICIPQSRILRRGLQPIVVKGDEMENSCEDGEGRTMFTSHD